MNNKKVVFSAFLTVFLFGNANAVEVASTQYVDRKNTEQTDQILDSVDTTLQSYSTTTQISNVVDQTVNNAIDNAITNINGNLTDMATKTWVGDQDYATNTALGTKADAAVVAGALGTKADVATTYTKTEVDNALSVKLEADDLNGLATAAELTTGLAGKEILTNKSNDIFTDTGSATKYPTIAAVQTYAIPNPPATCFGQQAQCVLSINKTNGTIYWDDVATP